MLGKTWHLTLLHMNWLKPSELNNTAACDELRVLVSA